MNKIYTKFLLGLAIMATVFTGCKKNDLPTDLSASQPDLVTTISSSVSGFVTDENDQPVALANVQVGGTNFTTDKYGYFNAENVSVIKEVAVVTVTKAGYFKGIKTYYAETGKAAFFRIKLMLKKNAGTVDATTGGAVTLTNGLSITLPAGSVVNASTNAAYTGTVNVAAFWIDPAAADLPGIMPGDLRGINTAGNAQLLTTYGMAAVELTGTSGEILQIATGKKATLNFPIPAAMATAAPATIPLWYFDEAKGLWKEEGVATKTGNNYVGEVSHFSFWNCDVPNNYVQFNCTLVGPKGLPLPSMLVKISDINSPANFRYGTTNPNGYVAGAIPPNSQLKIEVMNSLCPGNVLYTQTFNTTTSNVSLGTITINAQGTIYVASVSGTATNCNNTPLDSGIVMIRVDNQFYYYQVTNGNYSFNLPICNTSVPVSLSIFDLGAHQGSQPMSYVLNTGNNVIPTVQACGTLAQEYLIYTINNVTHYFESGNYFFTDRPVTLTNPTRVCHSVSVTNVIGTGPFNNFLFGILNNPSSNSSPLAQFADYSSQATPLVYFPSPGPITVQFTEYGSIGGYIAGNFSGSMKNNVTNINSNITASFRFKRGF